MIKHINIKIYGKVQGISFRWFLKKKAEKLGVYGFVRNEPDDSVYVEVEGDNNALADFLHYCRKGPLFARVERIEEAEDEVKNYNNFEIRY